MAPLTPAEPVRQSLGPEQPAPAASDPSPIFEGPSGQDLPSPFGQDSPWTYISPGVKIKGTITAAEDLYIDGDVRGSLSVPGHRLTIGERAYVSAETLAREIVIYGAIQGGLCAYDRIEIKRRGSVAGDLATAQIVIEESAHFKGVISADGPTRDPKPESRRTDQQPDFDPTI